MLVSSVAAAEHGELFAIVESPKKDIVVRSEFERH
jgi:hypothetical protein